MPSPVCPSCQMATEVTQVSSRCGECNTETETIDAKWGRRSFCPKCLKVPSVTLHTKAPVKKFEMGIALVQAHDGLESAVALINRRLRDHLDTGVEYNIMVTAVAVETKCPSTPSSPAAP